MDENAMTMILLLLADVRICALPFVVRTLHVRKAVDGTYGARARGASSLLHYGITPAEPSKTDGTIVSSLKPLPLPPQPHRPRESECSVWNSEILAHVTKR
jgi:hypothetical protein